MRSGTARRHMFHRMFHVHTRSTKPLQLMHGGSCARSFSAEADNSNRIIDAHGREHTYLRMSLTERCNLRCKYCMPAEGVELSPSSSLMTADQIVTLGKYFVGRGVDKIRLTGGEPLIRKDVVDICERLSALSGLKRLAVTTNALVLGRKMPRLLDAGKSHPLASAPSSFFLHFFFLF